MLYKINLGEKMTKKDLIKKLEPFKDESEIQLIDAEGNGFEIKRFVKSGIDPMIVIEEEDDGDGYEDEDDIDDYEHDSGWDGNEDD